jgi:membrane protein
MRAVDKLAPIRAIDRFQRRRRTLAVVIAVLKKVSDDSAGNYAVLIAYYGFLSLFPLLLLAVAILGFIVQSDAGARTTILNSGLPDIHLFGSSLVSGHITGSGLGVVVGALGALWAGLGVANAVQRAFNQIEGMPYDRRPNYIALRVRSIRLLASLGLLQILATSVAGAMSGGTLHSALLVVAAFIVATGFNLLLFLLAFRQLTPRSIALKSLWPGIAFATVGWELLQVASPASSGCSPGSTSAPA